jgi:glyoxylase-like metal-dependent hydrolase (beta-lactamase superfamily II)
MHFHGAFLGSQHEIWSKQHNGKVSDIRQASSPEQKARLEANLQQAEAYRDELTTLKPTLPTRTVASSVTLQEPGREIQGLLLGRGHTDGDVFIYLPKEKVVATGDAGMVFALYGKTALA